MKYHLLLLLLLFETYARFIAFSLNTKYVSTVNKSRGKAIK